MLTDLRSRLAALCVLFALLGGLLVAHGVVEPDPAYHDYPENEHLVADYDSYVGSGAIVSGRVVSTDPVVIQAGNSRGDEVELTLTGIDAEAGDLVWTYGVARPDHTVAVETAVVRSDWEIRYMYVVSALGGVLVLGRTLNRWRLVPSRLACVPRESPLSARVLDGSGVAAAASPPAHTADDAASLPDDSTSTADDDADARSAIDSRGGE
jgi:hypothetical protein